MTSAEEAAVDQDYYFGQQDLEVIPSTGVDYEDDQSNNITSYECFSNGTLLWPSMQDNSSTDGLLQQSQVGTSMLQMSN